MDESTSATELVSAAQAGDHRAFTMLLRDCDEGMRRLATRLLGTRTAMDDALQDAYLKAFRKLDTYNGDAAFSTWVYAIVYRTCLDHLRTRQRRPEVDVDLDLVGTSAGPGSDPAREATDSHALQQALDQLPADQSAAVLLVDGAGLTYLEAATVLDVAEGTIASRLHRAHSTLRTALDDTGGENR